MLHKRLKLQIILFLKLFILTVIVETREQILTENELKQKYSQVNTTYNDGRSCYRQCDGRIKTCYYEFSVQLYDTLSGLCGACANGTIEDCFNPGCLPANGVDRVVMTVNRQIPGPIMSVCKNDRIVVDVSNHMAGQELTMHWHGLHQKESPWFDGVPMVTQCPIFNGNTFRYTFNASEVGTHIYHAHSGVHRTNGVFGKLIVREPNDPNSEHYDYDLDEHTIIMAEWNNKLVETTLPGAIKDRVKPESLLVNGRGSYFDEKQQKYTFAPISVFYVERGKRHRFRVTNLGVYFYPLELSIQGNSLTVIATDGNSIEPVVVDSIACLSGERFDFVLNAMNDTNINETLMTIRALDTTKAFKAQEFARIIFVDDINNYSAKLSDHEPLKQRPAYESLDVPKISLNDPDSDCTDPTKICIAALKQKQVKENLRNEPAKVITLNSEITYLWHRPDVYISSVERVMVSMFNKISSTHPPVPGLIQNDSAVPYCNANNLPEVGDIDDLVGEPIYYCPHLIELELGKVYELILLDDKLSGIGTAHSMHLHGHAFQVIDMGTREQYESGRTIFANATHAPVIKDTISMRWMGYAKLRFRASNPGYWLFHCHLEFHIKSGMLLTFKVGNRTDVPPPPANFPTCGNFLTPVPDTTF